MGRTIRVGQAADELFPKAFTLTPDVQFKSFAGMKWKGLPKFQLALGFCVQHQLLGKSFKFEHLSAFTRCIHWKADGLVV